MRPQKGGGRSGGIDTVGRSRSRRRALQAVYAMQLSGVDARNAIAQFAHEQAHEVADLREDVEAIDDWREQISNVLGGVSTDRDED